LYYTESRRKRNIPYTIKTRKANWNGQILCRNYLLKHTVEEKVEGRIEGMRIWGIKCKLKVDDVNKTR
jgi:hypothetical protein